MVVASAVVLFGIYTYTRPAPAPAHVHWTGQTMGTTYSIKLAHSTLPVVEVRRLKKTIDLFLVDVNEEMSTYLPESEISRFNRHDNDTPFPVSAGFAEVTRRALFWADATGGAFDPTLDPLINLWGFGHQIGHASRPTPEAIMEAKAQTGYMFIQVPDHFHLLKSRPNVQLNLNAIAKGYGVDGVLALIKESGMTNAYVEIGGEVAVSGANQDHVPWRTGIEWPDPESPVGAKIHGVAHLSTGALATSGNYRRFRRDPEGRLVSHIIDPRTGEPVGHTLASVSVWAADCATADAVATALYVMGLTEGLSWVEQRDDLEALFFDMDDQGTVTVHPSRRFHERTGYKSVEQ
jgi:thiamine biosynthesis lipoprotein